MMGGCHGRARRPIPCIQVTGGSNDCLRHNLIGSTSVPVAMAAGIDPVGDLKFAEIARRRTRAASDDTLVKVASANKTLAGSGTTRVYDSTGSIVQTDRM